MVCILAPSCLCHVQEVYVLRLIWKINSDNLIYIYVREFLWRHKYTGNKRKYTYYRWTNKQWVWLEKEIGPASFWLRSLKKLQRIGMMYARIVCGILSLAESQMDYISWCLQNWVMCAVKDSFMIKYKFIFSALQRLFYCYTKPFSVSSQVTDISSIYIKG